MSSYYVQNLNPTTNSPSGSFSSSSSIATTSFHSNRTAKTTKTKPSNKAARLSTDPQSIAARQRRHRISDRFRALQSLVPGGSKLDTVSMLDEAINYVKLLKAHLLLHQSLGLAISGPGLGNDQNAPAGSGSHDGVPGASDGFSALAELPELPEGCFHLQGQECNFTRGTQYLEYY